jgi:hypothetical protein
MSLETIRFGLRNEFSCVLSELPSDPITMLSTIPHITPHDDNESVLMIGFRRIALLVCFVCMSIEIPLLGVAWGDELESKRRPLRFAETEFGRSLDAGSGGLSLPFSKPSFVKPLTIQLRLQMVPRSERFRSAILAATDKNAPVFQIIQDGRKGLAIECPAAGKAIPIGLNLADGKWHDVVVVFADSSVRVVVDGKELKKQTVKWAKKLSKLQTAWIGQSPNGKQRFDGLIDDVLITPGDRNIDSWKSDGKQAVAVNFDEDEADYLAQWTPLKSTRPNAEPWENETDADWTDARFHDMEKGRVFACSTKLPGHYAGVKNICIRYGDVANAGNATGLMMMFDTQRCVMTAARSNARLQTSPARFGILRMPELIGDDVFYVDARRALTYAAGRSGQSPTVRYGGWWDTMAGPMLEYSIDNVRLAEETHFRESKTAKTVIRRIVGLDQKKLAKPVRVAIATIPGAKWTTLKDSTVVAETKKHRYWISFTQLLTTGSLTVDGDTVSGVLDDVQDARIRIEQADIEVKKSVRALNCVAVPLDKYLASQPPAKGDAPIETSLVSGQRTAGSPFVVDRLVLPTDKSQKSLFFVTGVDKHRDSLAICTVHGEVWLVSGIDRPDKKLTWKRFATGLYQPLGLRTNRKSNTIDVLGRDQVTRLHDYNNDGRADFYENFNNDLVITGTAHAYATCLDRDPQGNYYFFKSGRSLPHGGKLLQLSANGKTLKVFASGYRHPIGLGVSPTGMVTAADNQGNWIPASSIQIVEPGSFHGYMPEIHQPKNLKSFAQPMCWIPMHIDSSSGGRVWVPDGVWGPLANQMLHMSWGRCTLHLVMPRRSAINGKVAQ